MVQSLRQTFMRERTVGMPKVIFTLRTMTPLFLAGADQTTAELRAPSFRGLLRYWQRALVGGLVPLETVKNIETVVFGATDTGSAVSIRVSATSNEPKEFTEQISVRVGGRWQATGKGYLLWTMAKSGRVERGNLKPARWYFPPGTSFQVTVSARGTDTTGLEQASAAFWIFTHLGGLGSRSRRCAGSLAVQAVENNITSLPFNAPENAQAFKLHIEQGIREAKRIAKPEIVKELAREVAKKKLTLEVAERELAKKVEQLDRRSIREAQFDKLA